MKGIFPVRISTPHTAPSDITFCAYIYWPHLCSNTHMPDVAE